MGTLRHVETGLLSALESDHLVGRSPKASLQLNNGYVSANHALIRWVSSGWEVKDLGSRNGTLIDHVPIARSRSYRLATGQRLSFGRLEQTWEMIDESPPRVMVVAAGGGEPLFIEEDLLPLPTAEDPRATIFRGSDGTWHLETDEGVSSLTNQQVFLAGGATWRFSCPEVLPATSTVDWPDYRDTDLRSLHLHFRLTRDEEHVEIVIRRGRETVEFGSRAHNYLLLLLARQHLADAAESIEESARGWRYQDELLKELRISSERLNIDIFRIRKQFAALGFASAAKSVERRPGTKQLRLGVASVSVETI